MPLSIPGPAGATGATGPAGPTGPAGAAGAANKGADLYFRQAGGGTGVTNGPNADRSYVAGQVAPGTLVSMTMSTGTGYVIPHYFGPSNHIVELGIYVATVATGNCVIAAYTNTGDGSLYPATQYQSVTVSHAAAGYQKATVSWDLVPNELTWFVIGFMAGPTVRAVPFAAAWPILGYDPSASGTAAGVGYTCAVTTGPSVPATFDQTRPAVAGATASYPAIFMKHG